MLLLLSLLGMPADGGKGKRGRFSADPLVRDQVLRIQHCETGASLHSHGMNYIHDGTSGQQQVTCFAGRDGPSRAKSASRSLRRALLMPGQSRITLSLR